MTRVATRSALLIAVSVCCWGQPDRITCSLPVNAVTWKPGLPAAGALATIFCSGTFALPEGTHAADLSSPLPYTMGGVLVTVNHGSAPILYVSITQGPIRQAAQINFQVPAERNSTLSGSFDRGGAMGIGVGLASAVLDGSTGEPGLLDQRASAGFLGDADGYAIARHASDDSVVTRDNPAHPGEEIIVYGNGFFSVWPPAPIGYPTPSQPAFKYRSMLVFENNLYLQGPPAPAPGGPASGALGTYANTPAVKITYEALAAGQIGIQQIHFIVPAGQKPGDWALFFNRGTCPQSGLICQSPGVSSDYVKLPVR